MMSNSSILRSLFFALSLCVPFLSIQATVHTVANNFALGLGSLRSHIGLASAGDTIEFDVSLFGDTITLATPIPINQDLHIIGLGKNALAISGGGFGGSQIFTISSGTEVVIEDLTFFEAYSNATNGGAINNEGDLTLNDCRFEECQTSTSKTGGAIYSENGILTLNNCIFKANEAPYGGAIYSLDASLYIVNSTYLKNEVNFGGGAIYFEDNVLTNVFQIENSTFIQNESIFANGAAICNFLGNLTVSNTSFKHNDTFSDGGAIFNFLGGTSQTMTMVDCVVDSNEATGVGGGVYQIGGRIDISGNTKFTGNDSNLAGGAIYSLNADLEILESLFVNNLASSGTAIYHEASSTTDTSLTIDQCSFQDNGAGFDYYAIWTNQAKIGIQNTNFVDNNGGGIRVENGSICAMRNSTIRNSHESGIFSDASSITIDSCKFIKNDAENGGGIYFTGSSIDTLRISNCVIKANNSDKAGGGIYFESAVMYISQTTLDSNRLSLLANDGYGAGIFNKNGELIADHCTISGNAGFVSYSQKSYGGGIFQEEGMCQLSNCTIVNNRAEEGGGIYQIGSASSTTLDHTILALNISTTNTGHDGQVLAGTVTSLDYNIIGDNDNLALVSSAADQLGSSSGGGIIDPRLQALANNGGLGLTHALECSSLAKNAGDNTSAPSTDQRGMARIAFDDRDIGAVELHLIDMPDPSRHTVNTLNETGPGSLKQLIEEACIGDTLEFDPGLFGGKLILTSEIVINKPLVIEGPGADQFTIDANNTSRVFYVNSGNEVLISGLKLVGGLAYDGGCVKIEGELELAECVLSSNEATNNGGACHIGNAAILALNRSTIDHNDAGNLGGGVHNDNGTLNLTQSTLNHNVAVDGGAIYNLAGNLNLDNSTLSNNTANGNGGGIYNDNFGTIISTVLTFTQNHAYDYGGGVFCTGGFSSFLFNNTLLGGNTAGIDGPEGYILSSATITSGGHNFVSNNSGFSFASGSGDQIGTVSSPILPLLDVLADNGGLTYTHLPLPGSPVIDMGNSPMPLDQRGYIRSIGPPDIGAAEFNSVAFPVEWLDFQVHWTDPSQEHARLEWVVAAEQSSSHYEVERSGDGIDFHMIGTVNSVNHSDEITTYAFTDVLPLADTYFYRLKQVDLDGQKSYSDVRILYRDNWNPEVKLRVWPNPCWESCELFLPGWRKQNIRIVLLDLQGREVYVRNIVYAQTPILLDRLTDLPEGLLLVRVVGEQGQGVLSLVRKH